MVSVLEIWAMYQVRDTILAPNLKLTACICMLSISLGMPCQIRTESGTEIAYFGPLQTKRNKTQRDENIILQYQQPRTPIPKVAVNVIVESRGKGES